VKVITNIPQMQKISFALKKKGKKIGVVPTMGYLHEGHLSLIRIAQKYSDIVILTLFINPTQFAAHEDLNRYPQDIPGDLKKCKKAGVDYVFSPKISKMYPKNFETYVETTQISLPLCGGSRPGHFRGVTTIVSKLFLITQPTVAVLGKKDFQQLAVIKRMGADLNFPIRIIGAPIVRDKDGLALSSRNVYLTLEERKNAVGISSALFWIRNQIKSGETRIAILMSHLKNKLFSCGLRLDYAECLHSENLTPLTHYQKGKTLFAVACFVGKTRLIDNIVV